MPKKGITAEQWLHARKQLLLFFGFIATLVAAVGVAFLAISHGNEGTNNSDVKRTASSSSIAAVTTPKHRSFRAEYGSSLVIKDSQCSLQKDEDIYLAPKRIYFGTEYVKKRQVHMPKTEVTTEATVAIQEIVDWVLQFGDQVCRVIIFTSVDAHGAKEFDLGLGQKMADSVRNSLIKAGLNADHIETFSFGKEYAKDLYVASAKSGLTKDYNNYADVGVMLRSIRRGDGPT
jgi:hypothetical protein